MTDLAEDCHRAVDLIASAWPEALDVTHSASWRQGNGQHPAWRDPVGASVCRSDYRQASDWLFEWSMTVRRWLGHAAVTTGTRSDVIARLHAVIDRAADDGRLNPGASQVRALLLVADTAPALGVEERRAS